MHLPWGGDTVEVWGEGGQLCKFTEVKYPILSGFVWIHPGVYERRLTPEWVHPGGWDMGRGEGGVPCDQSQQLFWSPKDFIKSSLLPDKTAAGVLQKSFIFNNAIYIPFFT